MWGLDQAIANSARQAEEISRVFEEQRKAERQHRERLEEGATSSIEQKKLIEEQVGILYEQNRLLSENYDKLKEMYDAQLQATEEAKKDLQRSRIFNGWMMVISIVAMLAAVASPIVTVLVS